MKSEIRDALSAGKEVIVHERIISMSGWSGNGYIILDPETGAGAYKISGGLNGGGGSWEAAKSSVKNIGAIVTTVAFIGPILGMTAIPIATLVLFGTLVGIALALINLEIALRTIDGSGPCDDALLAIAISSILVGVLGPFLSKLGGAGNNFLTKLAFLFTPLVGLGATTSARTACGKYQ